MNILIDTNIVIPLEPGTAEDVEAMSGTAADLVATVAAGGHRLFLLRASLEELASDHDEARREMRAVHARKYALLEPSPPIPAEFGARIGRPARGSHDWVDHLLLAAVWTHAVAFLVTEDERIHRNAALLGISDRVLTVEDALTFLQSLQGKTVATPPFVQQIVAYELDEADPIFDSIREDYGEEFDPWLVKCKENHRPAFVIGGVNGLAAVSILKPEDDELHLGGKTMKVCTFKVSTDRQGRRYGELLLKTIFLHAAANKYEYAFVTVFERHGTLITLLEAFGFMPRARRGDAYEELVYVKEFAFSEADRAALDNLEFHVRFGPPALKIEPDRVFIVPIQPRFHRLLFPETEPQPPLFPEPFGNAIRKAYLSNSVIRKLKPGDCLLFYKSQEAQGVSCVGVVEDVLVSADPAEVAAVVGQRTVYSLKEIANMCVAGEVLAIMFRQDRVLTEPIGQEELVCNRVMTRAPQSIASVRPEVTEWLAARVGA